MELFAGVEDVLLLDEEVVLDDEPPLGDELELDDEAGLLGVEGVEGIGGLPRSSRDFSRRSSRSLLEAGELSPLLEAGEEG